MRKIIQAIIALAGLSALGACSNLPGTMIVDWAPVDIYITATDSDGASIISPGMPGMSLTFKGETYTVAPEAETRAYAAYMGGLRAQRYEGTADAPVYRLVFGEIDGAADMDEDIVLSWPDGSTDTIHYHCSNHREWPEPACRRRWKLNGKSHDGCIFAFKGKNLPAGE